MNNCPVCEKDLIKKGDIGEDGSEYCSKGHYYYSHSYGCHEVHYDIYDDKMITLSLRWNYTEGYENRLDRNKTMQAFEQYARSLLSEN